MNYVSESAIIGSNVTIGAKAVIRDLAFIGSGTVIHDHVYVGIDTSISPRVTVGKGAVINENVIIAYEATIAPHAKIASGSVIGKSRKNVTRSIAISGDFGETGHMTGFVCDDGLIITCGCFNSYRGGTPDELREAVRKKYDDNHLYMKIISLIEEWA